MSSFAKVVDGDQPLPPFPELIRGHLLVVGQTGSGKTTTTLALLNQLQQTNATAIVLDPTGEYGRLPNAIVYRLGENAYLDAGNFNSNELLALTGLSKDLHPYLQRAMTSLRVMQNLQGQRQVMFKLGKSTQDYQNQVSQLGDWASGYPVELLADQLIEEMVVPFADHRADYQLLGQQYDRKTINRFWNELSTLREQLTSSEFQALFGVQQKKGAVLTELNFVLQMFLNQNSSHKTLVIDLSILKEHEGYQRIVISFLLKQMLNYRLRHPAHHQVRVVIDEAHRYLPTDQQLTRNGIFQMAREGRKSQLALILTTQSPLDLPSRLRSQFNELLVHRLLDQAELDALNLKNEAIMTLPVGHAVLNTGFDRQWLLKVNLPNWWQKE